jgi:hypothetical protein
VKWVIRGAGETDLYQGVSIIQMTYRHDWCRIWSIQL